MEGIPQMAIGNRGKFFDKVYRLLRKQYEVATPETDRPVLEQALFGVCLENARLEGAEAAFARIREDYFDWNEVRVSSPRELAESLEGLPDPLERARSIKAILQSVFESHYEFGLEGLRRLSLSQAAKEMRKLEGFSPFVIAFVSQVALKGHTIPLDEVTIRAVRRLGLAGEDAGLEEMRGSLERLIPKARGPAFSSLLRALAFDVCLPEEPRFRKCVLEEICPTAAEAEASAKSARAKRQKGENSRRATPTARRKHR